MNECMVKSWFEMDRYIVECKVVSSKLRYYNMFKTEFKEELYISLNILRKYKTSCARYRMTSHKLEDEIGRHHNVV